MGRFKVKFSLRTRLRISFKVKIKMWYDKKVHV